MFSREDTVSDYPAFIKKHPWIKYVIALLDVAAFLTLFYMIEGWWQLAVVAGHAVLGYLWYRFYSPFRDFWWGRKRSPKFWKDILMTTAAAGLLLFLFAFRWPFDLAFGDDPF